MVELLLSRSLDDARPPRTTGLGTLEFQLAMERRQFDDHNLVAVLPGSDPARQSQYMTLGAHYDHVGVGAPENGDSIYNGADDNASGTVALLELAELFASRPEAERPARSVLFIWNAAEESGLLGSEHFTDRPTVNRTAMIGHVNLDMVGRNGTDSLFVIGSRRLSTELGDWLEQVNASLPRPFTLDYTFDAPDHPEMLYCRSDHWNFARFGIPSVMIGSGLHEDYHKPSDHVEKLNYEKMRRLVELTAAFVERVANSAAAPAVDRPPPPIGTPCEG
jgi:Zn-dependent M28 family amino/carboxypeptidase